MWLEKLVEVRMCVLRISKHIVKTTHINESPFAGMYELLIDTTTNNYLYKGIYIRFTAPSD